MWKIGYRHRDEDCAGVLKMWCVPLVIVEAPPGGMPDTFVERIKIKSRQNLFKGQLFTNKMFHSEIVF